MISTLLFVLYLMTTEILNLYEPSSLIVEFLGLYNMFFCLGIFLFSHYSRFSKKVEKLGKRKTKIITLACLMIIFIVNLSMQSESVWSFIPAGLLGILLITMFLTFKIRIQPLINLGKHSYSLYITHFATIYLFHSAYYLFFPESKLQITKYWVFPMAIPVCLVVSYLFYELVEKRTRIVLAKIRSASFSDSK